MNTAQDVKEFVSSKVIAVAGISRDDKAFSCIAYRELAAKGYRLYRVNPNAETMSGEPCYPSLSKLPEKPDGVLVFTPPAATASVVRDAVAAGIGRVWLQQGSESPEALELCGNGNLAAVSGQCIMMYSEPVGSIHKFHRFFAKLFGMMPK